MKITYSKLIRTLAIIKKEFIQIRRDYIGYGILIIMPFVQMILFAQIMNTDPKLLPMVLLDHDKSQFSRELIQELKNTQYFRIIVDTQDEAKAESLLKNNTALFVLNIPPHFGQDFIRGKQPRVLMEADGTDPVAVSKASDAANIVGSSFSEKYAHNSINSANSTAAGINFIIQAKYNPTLISTYHGVPGFLVMLVSSTLIMTSALSIVKEYEAGTSETLLITPVRAVEIILGKIIPQGCIGLILLILSLIGSRYIFHLHFLGSLTLLILIGLLFILTALAFGVFISTLSRTQFEAANIGNTFVLPASLFTGFLFPFYAMPGWAQVVGEIIPQTHFYRITTNIMLKGATFTEVWPDVWPIAVFFIVTVFFAARKYRMKLD